MGITRTSTNANNHCYLDVEFCSAFVVVSWIMCFGKPLTKVFVWQPATVAVITCFCCGRDCESGTDSRQSGAEE